MAGCGLENREWEDKLEKSCFTKSKLILFIPSRPYSRCCLQGAPPPLQGGEGGEEKGGCGILDQGMSYGPLRGGMECYLLRKRYPGKRYFR